MYLKVSAKEALRQIDLLIEKGDKLKDFIVDDYQQQEEKLEKAEEEAEEKEDEEIRALEKKLESTQSPVEHALCRARMLQLSSVNDSMKLFQRKRVAEEIINDYKDQYQSWYDETLIALKDIFEHFAPIYEFETSLNIRTFEAGITMPDYSFRMRTEIVDRLSSNLDSLVGFHNQLKDSVRSPLIYLSDKAQIWFYDFSCQLTPASNEASLCAFVFQFGVGEWQEFSDAYEYIKGEEPVRKNWESVIVSAYDGINRKTNDAFGFPILKKQKRKLITLTIPSRFVASL